MSYASLTPPLLLLWVSIPVLRLAERSGFTRGQPPSPSVAAAVSTVCLSLIGFFTLERSEPIWDSTVYVGMVGRGGLFAGKLSPFCFRILTPAMARLSPLPLSVTFELLNQLSLWGTAMLLCGLLTKRRLASEIVLAAPFFLILSSFTKFVLWYRFGVDQLAIFGIVVVAWALVEQRFVLAALLAALFVLEKESVLLVAPFSYGALRASPRVSGRPLRRFVALAALWAPALVLFAVVRTSIRHEGPGIIDTILSWAKARGQSPKVLCESLFALPKTFGAIPLVMGLVWRRTQRALGNDLPLLATIGVFLLEGIFGGSDYERVYFLSMPFVLMVFLPLIEELALSWWQATLLALAQVSLLDVFAKPDFLVLPRWFMTNTRWSDLAEYGAKVLFWTLVLGFAGFGRLRGGQERSARLDAPAPIKE